MKSRTAELLGAKLESPEFVFVLIDDAKHTSPVVRRYKFVSDESLSLHVIQAGQKIQLPKSRFVAYGFELGAIADRWRDCRNARIEKLEAEIEKLKAPSFVEEIRIEPYPKNINL